MNKKIITLVVLIVIVVGGGLFYSNSLKNKSANLENNNGTLPQSGVILNEEGGATQGGSFTVIKNYKISDVTMHNKDGDCWTAVNEKVYDLTTWPEKHPGGDKAIFAICGIDGSSAFNKQHGGQEKPEKVLEGFYIGDLTN